MVRAIGVDPGTVSFDICGLQNGEVFLDVTLPSSEVSAQPQLLLDLLTSSGPVDMVIAPSGYGLPWVSVQEVGPEELFEYTLAIRGRGGPSPLSGMSEIARRLKHTESPAYFMPAVIHLPTVPVHRKVNKIDMGTADKLCCAVLGVYDQAHHFGIAYDETSFILVEVGGAFTAVMAVEGGKVVDGIGGTNARLGYRSLGAMDGELAYLLGAFSKDLLFSGGAVYVAGEPDLSPEDFAQLSDTDERIRTAWAALLEGIVKDVAAEMAILSPPREILLSGRLCGVDRFGQQLTRRLARFAPPRRMCGFAQVCKEAAQGAALIADGLAGGPMEQLIEVMELRQASGSVLDYLYVSDAQTLRQQLSSG
ncbi:MAG: hypothetical protein AMJ93_06885 [Anaerolineae bacterium SM23_84]|nr:MAG: hypothetical protein AMJ93_06885 [Anaerolineae bacterium SM23_84]